MKTPLFLRLVLCCVAAAASSSCATSTSVDYSWRMFTEAEASVKPYTCVGAAACDRAWRIAQAWISDTSAWKIRLATDSLIETYGPTNSAVNGLAFRLLRRPLPDGSEQFDLSAVCRSPGYLCTPIPTAERAVAQFALYMHRLP